MCPACPLFHAMERAAVSIVQSIKTHIQDRLVPREDRHPLDEEWHQEYGHLTLDFDFYTEQE